MADPLFAEGDATRKLIAAMIGPLVAADRALFEQLNQYAAILKAERWPELHKANRERLEQAIKAADDAIATLLDKNDELLNDLYLRRKLGDDWDAPSTGTDVEILP